MRWSNDGIFGYMGIVESCDRSSVGIVEGDSFDGYCRRSCLITSLSIISYGTPMPYRTVFDRCRLLHLDYCRNKFRKYGTEY